MDFGASIGGVIHGLEAIGSKQDGALRERPALAVRDLVVAAPAASAASNSGISESKRASCFDCDGACGHLGSNRRMNVPDVPALASTASTMAVFTPERAEALAVPAS